MLHLICDRNVIDCITFYSMNLFHLQAELTSLHAQQTNTQNELSIAREHLTELQDRYNVASAAAAEMVQEKQTTIDQLRSQHSTNQQLLLDAKSELQLKSVQVEELTVKLNKCIEEVEKNKEDKRSLSEMCEELIRELELIKQDSSLDRQLETQSTQTENLTKTVCSQTECEMHPQCVQTEITETESKCVQTDVADLNLQCMKTEVADLDVQCVENKCDRVADRSLVKEKLINISVVNSDIPHLDASAANKPVTLTQDLLQLTSVKLPITSTSPPVPLSPLSNQPSVSNPPTSPDDKLSYGRLSPSSIMFDNAIAPGVALLKPVQCQPGPKRRPTRRSIRRSTKPDNPLSPPVEQKHVTSKGSMKRRSVQPHCDPSNCDSDNQPSKRACVETEPVPVLNGKIPFKQMKVNGIIISRACKKEIYISRTCDLIMH